MPSISISLSEIEYVVALDEASRANRDVARHLGTILSRELAPKVEAYRKKQAEILAEAALKLDVQAGVEFAAALQLSDPSERIAALKLALDGYEARTKAAPEAPPPPIRRS